MSARVADRLVRAIRAQLAAFAGQVDIDARSTPWASVTFSGARHALTVSLAGPGAGLMADAFLEGLGDREFTIPGHIVADVAVADCADRDDSTILRLEILTIETD
jgi:hypothetical protein